MHDLLCKACTCKGLVYSEKEVSVTCYISAMRALDGRPSIFIRDKLISSERMFVSFGGGVRLNPLCTSATNWPIVPAPDDR
jgi:hypothetical protein